MDDKEVGATGICLAVLMAGPCTGGSTSTNITRVPGEGIDLEENLNWCLCLPELFSLDIVSTIP